MAAFQQMKDRLDALALDITAGVTKGEKAEATYKYVEFITTITRRKISDILQAIPSVPSFQRLVDYQRVDDIFNSIRAELSINKKIIFPGCIIIAKTDRTYWIIDGLHRLEVYKRILQELGVDMYINCDEIVVADEEEARSLFNKVNDTRILPEMPEGVDKSKCTIVSDW